MYGNNVSVVGNLTRDPEVRYSQDGMAIAKFGLAWNRPRKGDEDDVSFFDVKCFGRLAEHVGECLGKGQRVLVAGRMQQDRWQTEEGQGRSRVEVIADDVGASLLWSVVEVVPAEQPQQQQRQEQQPRRSRSGGGQGGGGRSQQRQAERYVPDEEPF